MATRISAGSGCDFDAEIVDRKFDQLVMQKPKIKFTLTEWSRYEK
jgi:hypothetical protein